jgi:hypothetical protein
MALAAVPQSYTFTNADSTITIDIGADRVITATIEVANLTLTSIKREDYPDYSALLKDASVMRSFAKGVPYEEARITRIFNMVIKRFNEDEDPYSAFSVTHKESGEYVGNIVVGHQKPGVAEFAILFHERFRTPTLGLEAAKGLFSYIAHVVDLGYKMKGSPLTSIEGSTNKANAWTLRVLRGLTMNLLREEDDAGITKERYSILTPDLLALYR